MIAEQQAAEFAEAFQNLVEQVARRVLGKEEQIRLAVTCLLAGGHLLIEDVPGVAKTTLAKAVAEAVGGDFRRIQFTPDLLPADVTGGLVYYKDVMEPRKGPVFTNVLLADEINRAAPRTQSALLEAMAESQVTLDGKAYDLPDPFLCIATQNPVEMYGTYELPEAQLDRFTIRLHLGYPDVGTEARAIEQHFAGVSTRFPEPGQSLERVRTLIRLARTVYLGPAVRGYIARIAAATRHDEGRARDITLGVSPRGSIALATCAMVLAASQKETWVTAQHVKLMAEPVLVHRLVMEGDPETERERAQAAVAGVLAAVRMPESSEEPPPGRGQWSG